MHEPATKRSCRACVGLDGARRTLSTSKGWRLTQGDDPGANICFGDLADGKEMAFGEQILVQLMQGRLMPFQCFWTVSGSALGLQIGLDRSLDGEGMASPS